jgi:hypothetical protein
MLSPDDQLMQDSKPMMTFLESEHPTMKTVPKKFKDILSRNIWC